MTKMILKLLLLSTSIILSSTSRNIDLEVNIPDIQQITILNQKIFNNLSGPNLDQGYYQLNDCLQLEIKSNTNWSLLVYNDQNNQNDFLIRTNSVPFQSITNKEIFLYKLQQPTASTIVSVDCKRIVNWDTTKLDSWHFSPVFEIINNDE